MAAKKEKPLTIGALIDGIYDLREDKRKLEAQVKEIEERIAEKEVVLMEKMDREGVDKSTGKLASAGISEVASFSIKDFDDTFAWAAKHKMQHIFQRRVSDVACREIYESGKTIPGLEVFKKRKVNIRVLATK